MPDFVHLHNHTHYSLLDAACKPEQLIEAAKADGQTALALTDHGVMFGCFEFYKKAKKAGIKPLLGCEVYVATGGSGGPQRATMFYNLYLYQNAFNYFEMGYASTMAWILFVIVLLLTTLIFRSSEAWVYYEGQLRGK